VQPTDHRLRDDPRRGCACLELCGGTVGSKDSWTANDKCDRLLYCYTKTEYMQFFEWRALSECIVRMLYDG